MALQIDIITRNMELTDRLSEYVNRKVSKLDKFINGVDETKVDLAFVKSARCVYDRHVGQITLRGKGFILRAEERSDDIFAAIDAAVEKLERQIERFKGKRQHSRETAPETTLAEPAFEEDERFPVIARRKEFILTPMDEFEAVEQMALLGHENFFIFFNANSNNINILYHRRDNTYGLIEPKLG
jgi:putative sigma-54 modulation protein